jgi:hypothetical protein
VVIDEGRTDLTGDERVVRRTYRSDDATWVRNRVTGMTVLSASGTVVTDTATSSATRTR